MSESNMSGGYYRSGQAAKLWGISSHLVRRLCESGQIEAEITDGGQWKIPRAEVERISKEGVPEIPSSIESEVENEEESNGESPGNGLLAPPSDGVVSSAEEVVVAENHLKRLKIEKDTEETRDWFRERQRLTENAERQERQAAFEQTAREQAERDRIAWHDAWLARALRSLPREVPAGTRLAVREGVAEVIGHLGPQHSPQIIGPLVGAAVDKALQPWHRQNETDKAIENACNTLPWGAKNSFSSTIWQTRAHEAATAAIRKIPSDSTFLEKVRVATAAVRAITSQFEHGELLSKMVREVFLWDISPEQREIAREAVQKSLESLPICTPARTMERARDQVLVSFREATKRKERVELALRHIRRYLQELQSDDEVEFESEREFFNFAQNLERRLRPVLLDELQNDDLSDYELAELVEDLVDEALD